MTAGFHLPGGAEYGRGIRPHGRAPEEVAVTGSPLRSIAVVIAAAGSALALAAAPAAGVDKPTATLTCEGGLTFTAAIVSLGTFHEGVAAGTFQLKYLAFGDTVVRDTRGVENNQDLVTCTYTGPVSGNEYVVKGFFTPVG